MGRSMQASLVNTSQACGTATFMYACVLVHALACVRVKKQWIDVPWSNLRQILPMNRRVQLLPDMCLNVCLHECMRAREVVATACSH